MEEGSAADSVGVGWVAVVTGVDSAVVKVAAGMEGSSEPTQ